MCELGLRAGGAVGAKRLVGRNELRRGLRALCAAQSVRAAPAELAAAVVDGEDASATVTPGSRLGDGWSEQEIDQLLDGLAIGRGDAGRGAGGGDGAAGRDAAELSDDAFRDRLMLAASGAEEKADREMLAAIKILPLLERLEVLYSMCSRRFG